MADGDLYETDILAWSEQQAAALRELASRRDLPNSLDLTHVAEEIEDVGLSQLNGVRSRVRLILEHALKCFAEPGAPSLRHWHREIANWQSELDDRFSPSMRQRIDLDTIWQQALKVAALEVNQAEEQVAARIAAFQRALGCPLTLDDIRSEHRSPADLVERLGAALAD